MRRKIAELINVFFGFRKFILMSFVISIAVIFRIKELINGSEMIDLLKSTTMAFIGANGVEHIGTMVRDYVSSKNGPAAPTDASEPIADTDESNDHEDVN